MKLRRMMWTSLGVAILLFLAVGGGWLFSLPASPGADSAPPVPEAELRAMHEALRPPKRQRPLIATIAINDATETTDYLMPYGVLKRADVADIVALATSPGPVRLFPALTVEPDATIAQFDAQYPDGADYVIVPAMSRDDDPQALQWIRQQAAKGASIIGVCAGAKVVAAAGLLDGKSATTHWYYLKGMLRRHPQISYVADRRVVVDERVATTTGVSASMPMALTLIEAIAGREKADEVARGLGMPHWSVRHDSSAFGFTRPFAATALINSMALWNREQLGVPLRAGVDEVSLALVADAWSRTYRSQALTYAAGGQPVETGYGMRVIPDRLVASWPAGESVPDTESLKPAQALDQALAGIADRYGDDTAELVAMQLEYPWRGAGR